MPNYMDRLMETDAQRQARLARTAKPKPKVKKGTQTKGTPLMKPTPPSLGNTIDAVKRRNKRIRNL